MHRRFISLSTLFFFAAAPAMASMSPAVDAVSLMDLRFCEQRGAFLVEHLELVFPQQAAGTNVYWMTAQ